VGSDTFTYTLCDDDTPTPTCDSATVTVEILAEPDCTIFINYPKDGVDLDLNELFLKSFDCYQAYEQEYGFAHTSDNLVWSNITIDGVAATHGEGTRGILSEDVVVDPAAYADGVVVVAGELALVHNSTTYMTATFTETFTDNGTTWVNSNSSETFDHILNPFAN